MLMRARLRVSIYSDGVFITLWRADRPVVSETAHIRSARVPLLAYLLVTLLIVYAFFVSSWAQGMVEVRAMGTLAAMPIQPAALADALVRIGKTMKGWRLSRKGSRWRTRAATASVCRKFTG
jgi:hypothetical protein